MVVKRKYNLPLKYRVVECEKKDGEILRSDLCYFRNKDAANLYVLIQQLDDRESVWFEVTEIPTIQ
jgi:hypothetical protein